jgi:hypothetical protein
MIFTYINIIIQGCKMKDKIPVGTRDTAVRVCGYARCPNLVTVPVPAEPVLETPRVFPYPC